MSNNPLGDRGKAMEDKWAREQDAAAIEKLKKQSGTGESGDKSGCKCKGDKSACKCGGKCSCGGSCGSK